MGLDRLRMVLAVGLFVGLGSIPLWSMAFEWAVWVGVGARYGLGSGVGDVALFGCLLRLGATATPLRLRCRIRIPLPRFACRHRLRLRSWLRLLHLHSAWSFPRPHAVVLHLAQVTDRQRF